MQMSGRLRFTPAAATAAGDICSAGRRRRGYEMCV